LFGGLVEITNPRKKSIQGRSPCFAHRIRGLKGRPDEDVIETIAKLRTTTPAKQMTSVPILNVALSWICSLEFLHRKISFGNPRRCWLGETELISSGLHKFRESGTAFTTIGLGSNRIKLVANERGA
jgi:hypothetical protein